MLDHDEEPGTYSDIFTFPNRFNDWMLFMTCCQKIQHNNFVKIQ